MELKNKVALITGSSQGIGKSTAIELSKQGASVIINYNSNEEEAKKVLAECNKHSKKNIMVKADIRMGEEVRLMFDIISKEYGKLDILINNAGIFEESRTLTDLETFDKIWSTNMISQVRIIEYCLKLMKKGKIINVSSVYGNLNQGRKSTTAYASLKASLDHYTKDLAKNLAPNILVNGIAPGKTLTPMWGKLDKETQEKLSKDHLINRFILPEEIADGIIFLLKNDAVCGEILTIDGGMSLKTLG